MQRLRTRAQFQAVMAAGASVRTAHFALHCLALPVQCAGAAESASPHRVGSQALFVAPVPCGDASGDCWVGPLVPRRWARRAVTRNTIRRQIYAVAAELAPQLQARPAAYVVRLRSGFARSAFPSATSPALRHAVRSELGQLFARHLARPMRAGEAAGRLPPATAAAGR